MRPPGPWIAVVLVATDERRLLIDALASLWAASPGVGLEVVVVDNASVDGTSDEVARRWPQVSVIRQPRRVGLSANVNAGIRATAAPYVMVCNSDVEFRPGACALLGEFLDRHPRAAIAAPRLLSPTGEAWPTARRWYSWRALALRRLPLPGADRLPAVRRHLYADWDGRARRQVDWVLCAATMLRRAALDEIGLMDERFRIYFGDVDLALRAHEAGWEVWAVPEAEVVHHWRRASRQAFSAAWFSHLRSLVLFVAKHRRLRPRRQASVAPTATGPR